MITKKIEFKRNPSLKDFLRLIRSVRKVAQLEKEVDMLKEQNAFLRSVIKPKDLIKNDNVFACDGCGNYPEVIYHNERGKFCKNCM